MDDLHRALARELTRQRRNARQANAVRRHQMRERSQMLDMICSAAGVKRTLSGWGWSETVHKINAAILRQRSALADAREQLDKFRRTRNCEACGCELTEGGICEWCESDLS